MELVVINEGNFGFDELTKLGSRLVAVADLNKDRKDHSRAMNTFASKKLALGIAFGSQAFYEFSTSLGVGRHRKRRSLKLYAQ